MISAGTASPRVVVGMRAGWRWRGLLGVMIAASGAIPMTVGAAPGAVSDRALCGPARPGHATCFAHIVTRGGSPVTPAVARAVPHYGSGPAGGYTPTEIRSAYRFGNPTATTTVAVVDAFHYASAKSDLDTYRAAMGLPACGAGCFREVDQNGGTAFNPGNAWADEIDLDLQAVSAVCPTCRIVLVSAYDDSIDNLMAGVSQAVALGATAISLSWGTPEFSGETAYDSTLSHPGVVVTASSGDGGFGVSYPAASSAVVAVGGTSLVPDSTSSRGWQETVWGGAGSGCSADEPKPRWQHDTGCPNRMVADISALADPGTGLALFDSNLGGWTYIGGTSLSSPVVAAAYAASPSLGDATAPENVYVGASLFDVTSGTNSSSGCSPVYLCTGVAGYDGPTGMGTLNGLPGPIAYPPVSVSPASVGFGSMAQGWYTPSQAVTVTDSGPSDLHVTGVSLGGANPSDFTITSSSCSGATIAAGNSCSAYVAFTPTATGTRSATLSIHDDGSSGNQTANLTAVATAPPVPRSVATGSGYGDVVSHYGPGAGMSAQWPGWKIARDSVALSDGTGGYVLDGWGGVHPYGSAVPVTTTAYWSGWDIARAIALRPDGHSGYVLDGWGGLHPFGGAPGIAVSAYWSGWDIARDVVLRPDGVSGYVLDGWGGLHPFGGAPPLGTSAYWQGWDIAHRFALASDGASGYVLDGYGGVHPFGSAPGMPVGAYWNGWDIARDIELLPNSTGGYVLDGWGGLHPFGGAPAVAGGGYTAGSDLWRSIAAS